MLTSGFGWRWGRMHEGIDISVSTGTPVVAAKAGVVIVAGWLGGYGNLVVVDHGGGVATAYGHNTSVTVGVGQYVEQGQLIAYSGSTGHSTGPHVHFEVRINGSAGRSDGLPLAVPRSRRLSFNQCKEDGAAPRVSSNMTARGRSFVGGRVRLGRAARRAPVAVAGEVGRQLLDRDDVQVGQRAPALVEPEAVAGEELVGDGEADVVERDVVDEPPVGAVEQGHGREARGLAERERAGEEVQRQAGVDHVLDHDHVAVDDRGVEILQQLDRAGVPARVGGQLEEVDRRAGTGSARERSVRKTALDLSGATSSGSRPRVGVRELGSELGHAPHDLEAREVDLPDGVAVGREAAG